MSAGRNNNLLIINISMGRPIPMFDLYPGHHSHIPDIIPLRSSPARLTNPMVFIFMSNAECLVLLVGDDPPQDPEQEVENLLNTDRDLSAPMRSQRSVYKGENE